MYEEIILWLEGVSGIEYDFTEDLNDINISDAFITPVTWHNKISILMDKLETFTETVDEFGYSAPDNLPSPDKIKSIIVEYVINQLIGKLDDVKTKMNVSTKKIKSADMFTSQAFMISKLIQTCIDNQVGVIVKLLTIINEQYDDALLDMFGLTPNDYIDIHTTINDSKDMYEEDVDE